MAPSLQTILLVDDELPVRVTVRSILEAEGYTVFATGGYQEAIQIFQEHSGNIDLLLVDVSLPYRNGCELAKALLRLKTELKVLFFSAYVGAEILRSFGISQADLHFLHKPFLAKQLTERVKRVLESTEPLRWNGSPESQANPDQPNRE